jgi:hypothetical protein
LLELKEAILKIKPPLFIYELLGPISNLAKLQGRPKEDIPYVNTIHSTSYVTFLKIFLG